MRTRWPKATRRIVEYTVAAIAGILLAWSLLLILGVFNGPYLSSRGHLAQALGLSQIGWLGPLLILLVVTVLAFYLACLRLEPKEEPVEEPDTRCIACGQQISHDWRLCPYCGSLVGTIKHPRDHVG